MEITRKEYSLNGWNFKKKVYIQLSNFEKILVTGSSGWLGRTLVSILVEIFPFDFSKKIIFASSTNKKIQVNDVEIRTKSLFEVNENFDLIFHFASLSQDKANLLGFNEFQKVNNQIQTKVLEIIEKSKSKYLVFSSSGAANPDFFNNTLSESKKIYGIQKNKFELDFLNLQEKELNSQIYQIYSLTGNQIQNPTKFAFGDFINQAGKNGRIEIFGSDESLRTYIDAEQFLFGSILNLNKKKTFISNSGGITINLRDLAKKVLKIFNLDVKNVNCVSTKNPVDNYSINDNMFNDDLITQGIKLLDIDEQIIKTKASFNSN